MMGKRRWPSGTGMLILIAVASILLHTLTNSQYGFHRDELATVDNGQHLDRGVRRIPAAEAVRRAIGIHVVRPVAGSAAIPRFAGDRRGDRAGGLDGGGVGRQARCTNSRRPRSRNWAGDGVGGRAVSIRLI